MKPFVELGRGLWLQDHYLTRACCEQMLAAARAHLALYPAVSVERPDGQRGLRYRVLDGYRIERALPSIHALLPRVQQTVNAVTGMGLLPLQNRAAAINLNVTPPGGEYRWHYDRNAVTAILYLNAVEGGETELLPGYRLHLGRFKHTALQRWADLALRRPGIAGLTAKPIGIAPKPGRLVVMRGDRCLHSVSPVRGELDRFNLIMTFDRPQVRHQVDEDLDPYLYSDHQTPSFDPNYARTATVRTNP